MAGRTRTKPERGILGVLGGMGPAATADFYTKLVEATPASSDQDHISVVIVADPRIPDRSHAIETGTDSEVLLAMLQRLHCLEKADVDAIAIPCNTAHFWLPPLKAATDIPFISLIEASVLEARRRHPESSTALVLGTRATVRSHLYDSELKRGDFRVVYPRNKQQGMVDNLISSVKTGNLRLAIAMFEELFQSCIDQADVVLLACTELPLAASKTLQNRRLIDTTAALVHACIAWAKQFSGYAREESLSEGSERGWESV